MPADLTSLQRDTLTEMLAASLVGVLPAGTTRQIYGAAAPQGKVAAVVGMRRVGKTMYLHQLRRERLALGGSRSTLPYISFEDERLAGLDGRYLGLLLDEFGRRTAGQIGKERVLWCFDEIQLVPGWERFVRRLLDAGDADVVVTGSSAALLSREIATAMRGRAWEVPVFPFSFAESLVHQKGEVPDDPTFLSPPSRALLERAFLEWLATGGFPEAQGLGAPQRWQLLRDYVDVAMLRDVVERHAVSNVAGLRWLVRHLLGNPAGPFSIEKFHATARSQGLTVSRDTFHQLLGHLEDCFLVRTVWMESASERQRMVNPRKAYPIDPGLIPVFDRTRRANLGHALETAVLVELERRHCTVTYVRTPSGFEVDFLAREPGGAAFLIQVCADASAAATAERELRALAEGARAHPDATPLLLTLTRDGAPPAAPGVTVRPAYSWMLEDGHGKC
ncbi:MAG: ATP-binding protein [Krumholzibacteria bacterium]|nr:ATP-binding protein [Candidatus Krumholzibacteria bacterium]